MSADPAATTAREAPLTGEPQPVDNSTTGRSTTAALLRAIADHVERGDEFRDGQWVACAPVTGMGEKWPWQRKPFVTGVRIAREVQVEQLRRLADWHWSPDE